MQQDAEECWSQLMYVLKEQLKDSSGQQVVDQLFGLGMQTKLRCEEAEEEFEESSTAYVLKCNIAGDTNHLPQGLTLGLKEDREKTSAKLGRVSLFKGSSELTRLPEYLTVRHCTTAALA